MTTGSSSHTHTVVIGGKTYRTSSSSHTHSEGTVPPPVVVPPPPPPPPVTPPLTPSGPITITQSGQVVEYKSFSGTGSGYAIHVKGTRSNPIRDVVIRGCPMKRFRAGVWAEHATGFIFEDNPIDDMAYAGIMVLNGGDGTIRKNTIRKVGIGQPPTQDGAVNAYGISVNHDGSGFAADVLVDENTVEDVPTWEALDTHGGLRITFSRNIVRRSRRGVMVTGGNGGVRATDCFVTANQFLSPVSIPAGQQYAIVPVSTIRLTVTGNIITGWGSGRDLFPPNQYPNIDLVYSWNVVT